MPKIIFKWSGLIGMMFLCLVIALVQGIIVMAQESSTQVWQGTCTISYWTGGSDGLWPVFACADKRPTLSRSYNKYLIPALNVGQKTFYCKVFTDDSAECVVPGSKK